LARQYSDPIKAILQELGANASESHTRAGKADVAFKVQLPGPLDHHFRIRDFGVSMSPETVEDVYVNYMNSDKRHTNSEGGMFGIGSKTPFAYENLDSFNITTYLNGVVRLYTMAYNERGIPQLDQYGEAETDEPDGVEVSFAVKPDDFNTFRKRAEHVFSFFKTAPTVGGVEDFAANTYTKEYEGSNWYLTSVSGYRDDTSYVIMGDIGYPVNSSHFSWSSSARKLYNLGLHFRVEMAEVDIVPSREGLEYTDKTKKCLEAYADAVLAEIQEVITVKLNEAHSDWQANILVKKLEDNFSGFNFKYSDCKFKINKDFISLVNYRVIASYGKNWKDKVTASFSRPTTRFKHGNYTIVIKDGSKLHDKKCRILAKESDCGVILLEDIHTKKEVMDLLGAIDKDKAVLLVGELPDPPKAQKSSNGSRSSGPRKKTRSVVKLCPHGDSSDQNNIHESRYWEAYEVDYKVGEHVYVSMDRYSTEFGDRIYQLLKDVKKLGITLPIVIGLRNNVSKLAERSNFTSLSDWLKKEMVKMESEVAQACMETKTINAVSDSTSIAVPVLKSLGKKFQGSDIKADPLVHIFDFIKNIKEEKEQEKTVAFLSLANKLGYSCKKDSISPNGAVIDQIKPAQKKYPLFFAFLYNKGLWELNRYEDKSDAVITQLFDLINLK